MSLLKRLRLWWRQRSTLRLLDGVCRENRAKGYEEDDARCHWSEHWQQQGELIRLWSGSREHLKRAADHPHVGLATSALQRFVDEPGPDSAEVLRKALGRKGLKHTAAIGLYLTGLYDESNRETVLTAVASEFEGRMSLYLPSRLLAVVGKRPEPSMVERLVATIEKKLATIEPVGIGDGRRQVA